MPLLLKSVKNLRSSVCKVRLHVAVLASPDCSVAAAIGVQLRMHSFARDTSCPRGFWLLPRLLLSRFAGGSGGC